MPANLTPEYFEAEKAFKAAKETSEKIIDFSGMQGEDLRVWVGILRACGSRPG